MFNSKKAAYIEILFFIEIKDVSLPKFDWIFFENLRSNLTFDDFLPVGTKLFGLLNISLYRKLSKSGCFSLFV